MATARTDASKAEPKVAETPKANAKAQQDAKFRDATRKHRRPINSAAANRAPGGNGLMAGAQPVVPAGSFDGRWAGLQ